MASYTLYMIMQAAGIPDNKLNKDFCLKCLREDSRFSSRVTTGFLGAADVEWDNKEEVATFLKEKFDEQIAKQKAQREKALEEAEKAAAIAEFGSVEAKEAHDAEIARIMITSGHDFEGYRIIKYSGYISGDDAVEIPRNNVFDKKTNGGNLTDALVRIRRQSLKELKEAAYDLGCNAVIGVDFDYITLEPETISGTTHYYEPYVICVTANGTAVKIEKE